MILSRCLQKVTPSLACNSKRSFSKNASVFDWTDALQWRQMLTSEEAMIFESATNYCQNQLFPRVLKANREEFFDRSIMSELGELGFLGECQFKIKSKQYFC